jgi:hypothetical protein
MGGRGDKLILSQARDGEMLWGYFFTDPDPKKLELAAQHFIQKGFRYLSFYEADDKGAIDVAR